MKANEFIEKILNKEIKSGQKIRIHNNFMDGYDVYVIFNGNWFSKVETPRKKYDDMICNLCNEGTTYYINNDIEEIKLDYAEDDNEIYKLNKKLNEVIRKINKMNK